MFRSILRFHLKFPKDLRKQPVQLHIIFVHTESLDISPLSKRIKHHIQNIPHIWVLLHGSDTLTYTAALLAHLLPDKPLVLVAAGTPPEAPGSNALPNLDLAVQYLLSGAKDGVQIAYDGLHPAWATTEADCNDRFHHASVPFVPVQAPAFHRRRILQITPHPGIDYGVFDLTGVDAVLHRMYHSATVPEPAAAFAHRCKKAGVPCLFVTPKPAVAYVTATHLPGIWTSTTPESAFAKLLLTNGQDFDTMTLQVNENR